MKRGFRLKSSTDFRRVRRLGKSFAHPLLVLIILPNDLSIVRVGISASHAVGNAVQRNWIKRRIRASIDQLFSSVNIGYDLVFVARRPILNSDFSEINMAMENLLRRAGLLGDIDGR